MGMDVRVINCRVTARSSLSFHIIISIVIYLHIPEVRHSRLRTRCLGRGNG